MKIPESNEGTILTGGAIMAGAGVLLLIAAHVNLISMALSASLIVLVIVSYAVIMNWLIHRDSE